MVEATALQVVDGCHLPASGVGREGDAELVDQRALDGHAYQKGRHVTRRGLHHVHLQLFSIDRREHDAGGLMRDVRWGRGRQQRWRR